MAAADAESPLVCPETLAGTRIELLADGAGGFYCSRCGADYAVVMASAAMVQQEWTAGGTGWRTPRPGEIFDHRERRWARPEEG